jgi:hypothetical protein
MDRVSSVMCSVAVLGVSSSVTGDAVNFSQ